MKIWCESCEGKELIADNKGDNLIDCPKCNGKGYTENTELERLAEIGRATEKAFEEKYFLELVTFDSYGERDEIINTIKTIDDLLDWAKED